MHPLLTRILKDIKVELTEEFDRNFERKAFFNHRWPDRRFPQLTPKGSTLMVSGNLRRAITMPGPKITGNTLTYEVAAKYAKIHNEGGRLEVTARRKKFFWAMYYKTKNEIWRGLALKRKGSFINIPQRQFIGDHPEVRRICREIITDDVDRWGRQLFDNIKNSIK